MLSKMLLEQNTVLLPIKLIIYAAGEREAPLGVVLTHVLSRMLLEQARSMEALRLAAFAKRLAAVAVQMETGPAMGLLAVLDGLLRCGDKWHCL